MVCICQTALGGGNSTAVGLQEVGTTRQEELKIRLRLSPFSQRGPLTDERRRTATSMQNALTFKFRRWRRRRRKPLDGIRRFTDLLEEGGNRSSGTASLDKDNYSSSQGGVADERSKTNSHYDADAYFNDYGYLTDKDNVLGGGNRSTEFFVPRTHSTDLEAGIRQDQLRDFVDGQLEANRGRRRGS